MELELALDPDDAGRLSRSKLLAPLRAGGSRGRRVRIVWHDSPAGTLAEHDLIIARQGQSWRLERLSPNGEFWPPGTPAPVLEQARSLAALSGAPPALAEVAAFEGRALELPLNCERGPAVLTLLQGAARGISAELRLSRVRLAGSEPMVAELAKLLAGELRLSVPCQGLAAEAIAWARGAEAPPRHHGPPELPDGLSIAQAFSHVAGQLTDVILHFAPAAADGGDGPEAVHQMRVAVRRLRSVIKVFHRALPSPDLAAADAGLKALSRELAPTRDWDVFVTETAAAVGDVFPGDKRLHRLLRAAQKRRKTCHVHLSEWLHSAEFRRLGITLACLAGGEQPLAPLDEDELHVASLTELAAQVLGRRCKKLAQVDADIATLEPRALHGLRLRAKRLRYAAEIFEPIYPGKTAHRFIRRLSRLQDRLGTLNDGAMAAGLLAELPGEHGYAIGLVLGFLGARAGKARGRIDKAWQRFLRATPFWE
jgi:triphosphatase